jgi:hypothetical protein
VNNVNTLSTQIHHHYTLSYVSQLFQEVPDAGHTNSIFMSQQWFAAWLSTLESQPMLVVFSNGTAPVGFAFLGKQKAWYGDIYYLNQTGSPQYDQMWIEHNDIISSEQWLAPCRLALLNTLSKLKRFHRLVVSLSPSGHWQSARTFLWSKTTEQVACVDTSTIQNVPDGMLKLLSKNARSTINRAHNYIKKQHGDILIQRVETPCDTLSDMIGPLHIAQWQGTDSGSGFTNRHFVDFHRLLCQSNSEAHRVEILNFRAGDHDLGYLYMMLSHKRAYFYLSAINYQDQDNRYKPGMVMHKLAIERYANLGYELYDFLAGHARYKESLSNHHYPLCTLHIANRALPHRILHRANRIIKRITKRISRTTQST